MVSTNRMVQENGSHTHDSHSSLADSRVARPCRRRLRRAGHLRARSKLARAGGPVQPFAVIEIALLLVIAAWAVATGAAMIIAAVRLRKRIHGEWLLMVNVLSVAFGVLMSCFPAPALWRSCSGLAPTRSWRRDAHRALVPPARAAGRRRRRRSDRGGDRDPLRRALAGPVRSDAHDGLRLPSHRRRDGLPHDVDVDDQPSAPADRPWQR
jgi:hypothetical protein